MRKMRIKDIMYDVLTYTEFCTNRDQVMRYPQSVAVMPGDGYVYPIRNPASDIRPGLYPCGGGFDWFKRPVHPREMLEHSQTNIIDFADAHTLKDVIQQQDRLNKEERAILTTINSLTAPTIQETDEPAMMAIKQAIIAKHIDLDSYDYRFGTGNYPNDKRLLRKSSISLKKLIAYCNALDLKATLILTDVNPDVPNPMGKEIVYDLNFGDMYTPTDDDVMIDVDTDKLEGLAAYNHYLNQVYMERQLTPKEGES